MVAEGHQVTTPAGGSAHAVVAVVTVAAQQQHLTRALDPRTEEVGPIQARWKGEQKGKQKGGQKGEQKGEQKEWCS